ncbi:MAG: phosphonate metabolism protein/1,5-bisphosphokinase (PRPP-forming) PhnN [Magnetospiraceae bacterium]
MEASGHATRQKRTRPGTLFLVVGPSGAGKDTLIRAARARFAEETRFVFPRRYITRAPDPKAEDHMHVDHDTYETMRRDGAFALSWSAYGDYYGVPRDIERDLADGKDVVVNVSRTIVDAVSANFPSVKVIWLTVAPEILSKRLRQRPGIQELDRLVREARAQSYTPHGDNVRTLANNGDITAGADLFIRFLTEWDDAVMPLDGNSKTTDRPAHVVH